MRKLLITALLATAGCSMNPKLEMPAAPVAATYPVAAETNLPDGASLGWREMFGDPRLQKLIALALDENRDLRLAVQNAQAARAQLRVQQASQLPAANLQGSYTRQRMPSRVAGADAGVGIGADSNAPTGFEFGQFSAQAALTSFEIDLFGRLRSLSQAAAERYLASQEGQRAAHIAVVTAVVDAYLSERLADEQLRLTSSTLDDWQTSLDLTQRLRAAGQVSGLEVTQAEGLVRQARADREQRKRELAQATNALVLAVGAPLPVDLPAAMPLMDQPIRTQIAAGLPSDLLLRRPDILQAEHELRASNADVGAARAAFFPRLSLTGAFGFVSLGLSNLFQGDNRNWSFSPTVSTPIFQGGQLRGDLDLAKARKSIAVVNYERAIQSAFREVADGLAGRETFDAQFTEQSAAVETARKRVSLSTLRFRAGVDSRLELLDAQRSAYSAQQALLTTRQQGLSNAVGLYRALGGGLPKSS
ncbi:MAG: efflux transporter outer membrane subunit [Proteobacteria bacterium]|nr:efflux transporter outer membrane subunit [Pseudomonadota bacterium]